MSSWRFTSCACSHSNQAYSGQAKAEFPSVSSRIGSQRGNRQRASKSGGACANRHSCRRNSPDQAIQQKVQRRNWAKGLACLVSCFARVRARIVRVLALRYKKTQRSRLRSESSSNNKMMHSPKQTQAARDTPRQTATTKAQGNQRKIPRSTGRT
jgi:hypothetical protein